MQGLLLGTHRISTSIPQWSFCAASRHSGARNGLAALAMCSPLVHQLPALFEQVTPAISRFRLVIDDVGQRSLTNLIRKLGAFRRPVTKGGPEAVDRDVGQLHSAEHHGHHHAGDRLVRLHAGEYEIAEPNLGKLAKDGDGAGTEGNAMLSSRLHPHSGNGPDGLVEIKLFPFRIEDFTGAGRRKDREFERHRAERLNLPDFRNEGRNVFERHRRVVATRKLRPLGQNMIEMAAPARRVLTAPPAAHLGVVQHAFDPASEARGCLRYLRPKRLQHGQDFRRVDCRLKVSRVFHREVSHP
jgi:hypothetical protein